MCVPATAVEMFHGLCSGWLFTFYVPGQLFTFYVPGRLFTFYVPGWLLTFYVPGGSGASHWRIRDELCTLLA